MLNDLNFELFKKGVFFITRKVKLWEPPTKKAGRLPILIILVDLCAAICGADSFVEMKEFGNAKLDFLINILPMVIRSKIGARTD